MQAFPDGAAWLSGLMRTVPGAQPTSIADHQVGSLVWSPRSAQNHHVAGSENLQPFSEFWLPEREQSLVQSSWDLVLQSKMPLEKG